MSGPQRQGRNQNLTADDADERDSTLIRFRTRRPAYQARMSVISDKIDCMKSGIYLALFFLFSSAVVAAQDRQSPDNQPHITPKNMPQPKQDAPDVSAGEAPVGESSSRDSQISLEKRTSKPANDASGPDDVQEMRPYDPHKAAKDVEVGQYYLKQKNY